jgi:predicted metal-binding protein
VTSVPTKGIPIGAEVRFLVLGAGACHLCEPCNDVNHKPCRHPNDAIVSMETCGIDVMRLL